ncbi:Flavodoxin [bioreactor metagenome]|uniref:Flavodoxin n=1 Tax=bioreactor metagenome TaxID=1076179 RepID=A0A644Y6J3_9ZZZZ
MKKLMIVYWSGTGNTAAMAESIGEGASSVWEGEVQVIPVDKVSKDDVLTANALAFGCPAMGNEVLEESEMEPFIESLNGEKIIASHIALFGSYDWGDGQWMNDWVERMTEMGFTVLDEGLVVHNAPDETALEKCRQLGKKLAVL